MDETTDEIPVILQGNLPITQSMILFQVFVTALVDFWVELCLHKSTCFCSSLYVAHSRPLFWWLSYYKSRESSLKAGENYKLDICSWYIVGPSVACSYYNEFLTRTQCTQLKCVCPHSLWSRGQIKFPKHHFFINCLRYDQLCARAWIKNTEVFISPLRKWLYPFDI